MGQWRLPASAKLDFTSTTSGSIGLAASAAARREGPFAAAVSNGELELEVRSLALPAFNRSGETIGALSIAVRAARGIACESGYSKIELLA